MCSYVWPSLLDLISPIPNQAYHSMNLRFLVGELSTKFALMLVSLWYITAFPNLNPDCLLNSQLPHRWENSLLLFRIKDNPLNLVLLLVHFLFQTDFLDFNYSPGSGIMSVVGIVVIPHLPIVKNTLRELPSLLFGPILIWDFLVTILCLPMDFHACYFDQLWSISVMIHWFRHFFCSSAWVPFRHW